VGGFSSIRHRLPGNGPSRFVESGAVFRLRDMVTFSVGHDMRFTRSGFVDAVVQTLLAWTIATLAGGDQQTIHHSQSDVPAAIWADE
jgi:hypothetical protein